jgi:SpoVK/Ycf46/Vps4 family AAA+-type ATPase
VGETEKQLDEVFATADTGHILLLFDEADSLFAKRTEVKGANERYANMEVNYLLQRLESFSGIALLTTNMDSSIDAAFRRRLAAHIIFPLPDEDERAELWRRMLPAEAPCADDLDFDTMAADFPAFSGANIRNASILAGYFAADAGGVIDQQTFERAAREELRSMGRIVHGAQR